MMAVYDHMEQSYSLLGATAVEDKLQDGVRDTLVNLGLAGISVWILTGDKKETAINIRYSVIKRLLMSRSNIQIQYFFHYLCDTLPR